MTEMPVKGFIKCSLTATDAYTCLSRPKAALAAG